MCEVAEKETIPDFTVIYGSGMRRLDMSGVGDMKMKATARQVEILRKLIPTNPAKFQ
jgi:dynactin-6